MDINDVIRAKLFGSGGNGGESSGGSGIVPSGTLDITENGSYDVTNYAKADVNVEASGGDSGGGLKYASGSWTPASKTARMTIDLDFVPKAVSVWLPDFDTNGLDGTAKVLNALYVNGLSTVLGTNASGTSVSAVYTNNTKTELITNDINSVPTPYVIRVLESGGFTLYNNREFPAGYTYAWEAWGE